MSDALKEIRPRQCIADGNFVRPDWTAMHPRDSRLLWLDKNESVDPEFSAFTAGILSEVAPRALHTYPDLASLYNKLSLYLGLNTKQLVLAPGSEGAIRFVFEAFIDPGNRVICTSPTFAMYGVYCRMFGAQAVDLEYEASPDGPILFPETVIDTISEIRPKLVCLPNPDSPTGTVFSPDALLGIVQAAEQVGSLMLVDEAYHPFYEPTIIRWTEEFQHLIVLRTFSKAWGLAGLRIGYAVACRKLVEILHKVRPMYEVNSIAVQIVDRMLDHSEEMVKSVNRLKAGMDFFVLAMRELGLPTLSTHGNFVHVAFGRHEPAVHPALEDLVLYRGDSNEPCLAGFSRFSATTIECFRPLVKAIQRAVLG